jgi:hypothetical protein
VVEVYLRYENEQIKIPDFLHVQKEVTGDKNYEVSWLARNIPGNEPAAEAGYRGCSFPDSSCPII